MDLLSWVLAILGPCRTAVMEGKAVLFKDFAGVNAVPICLSSQDTDVIVEVVST